MINIRRAAPSDEKNVTELLEGLLLSHPLLKLENFFVADKNGEVIGVAHFEDCGENGYLSAVGVREEMRRKGVARALVSAVLGFTKKDVYVYTLESEVFSALGFIVDCPPGDIPSREIYDCREDCDPDECSCMVIRRQ